jgi:hypothetical protein
MSFLIIPRSRMRLVFPNRGATRPCKPEVVLFSPLELDDGIWSAYWSYQGKVSGDQRG